MEKEIFDERELLDHLRKGDLSSRKTYHAIQTLGRMNFREARPDIEKFLTNSEPELRMVALKVLTRYWHLPEHWSTALRFLESDPDVECRMRGATALGDLKVNTSDPETLKELAKFVKNEHEEELVRETAYAAIRSIIHNDPREQLHLAAHRIDLTKEVDWNMINTYVP